LKEHFVDSIAGSVMKPPKTISAAEFEGRCKELIALVTRTRQPLLITRRGKAVAQISPFSSSKTRGKKAMRAEPLNPLEGSIVYEGDLISPIDIKWKEMP
jgi:antitoxin (DNA-binding transcriptional repressor) of toxin-antitoxin stability system